MTKRQAKERAPESEPDEESAPLSGEHHVQTFDIDLDEATATNRDPAVVASRERHVRAIEELKGAQAVLDVAERAYGEAQENEAEERWFEVEKARRRVDRARVSARTAEDTLESVSAQVAARWRAEVSQRYSEAIRGLADATWMKAVEPMVDELLVIERRRRAMQAEVQEVLARTDRCWFDAKKLLRLLGSKLNDYGLREQIFRAVQFSRTVLPAAMHVDENNLLSRETTRLAFQWMQSEVDRKLAAQARAADAAKLVQGGV